MTARSNTFWGLGPHVVYHDLGQDIVVAVYDSGNGEQIEGAIIKAWYGWVEVLLPSGTSNGCRVVVVG